jgi:hypothetical protein
MLRGDEGLVKDEQGGNVIIMPTVQHDHGKG